MCAVGGTRSNTGGRERREQAVEANTRIGRASELTVRSQSSSFDPTVLHGDYVSAFRIVNLVSLIVVNCLVFAVDALDFNTGDLCEANLDTAVPQDTSCHWLGKPTVVSRGILMSSLDLRLQCHEKLEVSMRIVLI